MDITLLLLCFCFALLLLCFALLCFCFALLCFALAFDLDLDLKRPLNHAGRTQA
ncbi:hypothetical protein VRB36_14305 [Pseudomonas poae]|uniref:hypothetical protein n=1 Tax=Pseudomonas poae TaxID=200451 RepID=UPI0030CCC3C0